MRELVIFMAGVTLGGLTLCVARVVTDAETRLLVEIGYCLGRGMDRLTARVRDKKGGALDVGSGMEAEPSPPANMPDADKPRDEVALRVLRYHEWLREERG